MTGRRPTSFDIAALAGVSQPTVSRALSGNKSVSEETRRKVVEAAEKLNYTVDKYASGLRKRTSDTLALLFFEDPTPDDTLINPFYLSMLGGIARAASARGYDLLISIQQLSEDWHVDYEDSHKADGIMLLGYGDYLEARPRLEQLVQQGTHFVRWGAAEAGQIGTTVGSDNGQGGYLVGKHLLDRGRSKVAFLGLSDETAPEFLERYLGLSRALGEEGHEVVAAEDAIATAESGRNACERLLDSGVEFDAIFCAADIIAIGAMKLLSERGLKIPDDVSVVGFDDTIAARMSEPALTSVVQDTRRAAETLVDTLIAKIQDAAPESVLLPVELKVRGSS
ncbi:LacI family DNA-binding transcriptional regulator [Sphingomicrobium sediminis]|uniref:LacI family DNA-binding transcriptional regulator n=1 Tax=Sphingomicrobium sediminis TaxID=2950949 RepID=A0A9X2J0F1_9SPHN|nr:LacI family DNA-binding transcriptional regulator [Sphingomicrobium sediminis]MCM8556208.1 LacI family DNA-binding transcriptional regulator [Sphingomicrobium sediminis]